MLTFFLRPHVRPVMAVVPALLVFFLIPSTVLNQQTRLLLAWNVGATLLLTLLALLICSKDGPATYEYSQRLEPNHRMSVVISIVTSIAAMVGMAGMLDMPQKLPELKSYLHLTLSIGVIATAWMIVHTYFALQYARMYYDETAPGKKSFVGGLAFPQEELPDYWDFMYFSLTIAMCYQTSDVSSTSRAMRRMSLFHAVVSFFFVMFVIGAVAGVVQNLL